MTYSPDQQQYNQDVTINFQGEDQLSDTLDKINEKVGNVQFKLVPFNFGLELLNKNTKGSIEGAEKLSKGLTLIDSSLQKVYNTLGLLKVGTILAKGFVDAQIALGGFNEGIKAMNASGFDTRIIDQFTQLSSAIALDKTALESFSFSALSQFNQYNKALTEVKVLFDKADEVSQDFTTNLSKNIQGLVNGDLKNAITSVQALGAAYQAASAGFISGDENTSVMTAGLKLAKAGGADTGAVMKVLTQTIRAYELSANDANKVAAVLNKTIQLGITTLPELSQGFAQTAVTAKAAGVKLQDLAGGVAALTLKGFDTPAALTGLESLFRVIISKTPQAEDALRNLRDESNKPIRFDIAEIRANGLAASLDRLNKAAKGSPQFLREIIPESTAYNTALALMANNAKQLKDNTVEMFKVSGTGKAAADALDKVFGIKLNNQSEKFEQIINKLTEQFIQFGEQLAPFFEEGVAAVQKFTDILAGISPEWKKNIANMLIFQFGVNKTIDVVGILVGAVQKAFLTFQGWRYMMMLMNGTLMEQFHIVSALIKNNVGIIPVLKQLIGIDQSKLLLEKGLVESGLSRVDIITRLKAQQVGWLSIVKQSIGIDQSHLLNFKEGNAIVSERDKLIKFNIESNKSYVKELTKLTGLEKEYNTTLETSAAIKKALLEDDIRLVASKEKLLDANINKASGSDPKYQRALQETQLIEQQMSVKKTELLKLESTAEHELAEVTKQGLVTKELEATLTSKLNQSIDANILAKEKAIVATNLRKDAELANIQALEATTLAEAANSTNVTLNTEAEAANTIAKDLNIAATSAKTEAELASTAALELNKVALVEQAVVSKELLLVNGLLGKSYIANNAITRFFFQDVSGSGKAALEGLATNSNKIGGLLTGIFQTLGKGITVTLSAIMGLAEAALPVIGEVLIGLSAFAIPIAGLIIAGAVLYDQFFGTSAKIREMHENVVKINNLEKEDERKLLSKLDGEGKLNKIQKERLELLIKQQASKDKVAKKESEDNSDTWNQKYVDLVGPKLPFDLNKKQREDALKALNDQTNNMGLNKLEKTFNDIGQAADETGKSIVDTTASISKLENGLTGIDDIDELIKKGQALGGANIEKVKNDVEVSGKQIDLQINGNKKQLEIYNKQLEDFDKLSPAKQKLQGEDLKQFARERDLLQEQTDKLENLKSKRADDIKSYAEYSLQKDILIKRLKDNQIKVDPTTNTTKEDVDGSVNAVQVRLKKGFRTAKEDLKEYKKIVEATVDGTGQYVDATNHIIKIKTGDMTQYVQKFDNLVTTVSGSIDQLYQNNYSNGQEAAKNTMDLLDSLKSKTGEDNILDQAVRIQLINQAIAYAKAGDKEIQELLNIKSSKYKALQDGGVISAKDSASKIRKIQEAMLEASIDNQKKTLANSTLKISASMLTLMKAQLELSQTQFKSLIITNTRAEIDARFKVQQDGYSKESQLILLNRAKLQTDEEQTNVKLDEIKKKDLKSKEQQLQKHLQLVGNDKEERINIEKEILALQTEYQNIVIGGAKRAIDVKFKAQQDGYQKEEALVSLNRAKHITGEEQTYLELDNLKKKDLISKQQQLQEQLKLVKNDNVLRVNLEKQLLGVQLDYQNVVTGAIERELVKRTKIIQNATAVDTQEYKKLLDTLDFKNKSLDEENKIRDSQYKLIQSTASLDEGRLQNQLKITGDIQKRADIEVEVNTVKQKNLIDTQKYEQQSFKYQQEAIQLALQRQTIELNIKKLDNETNKKILELELEKGIRNKINKEDIDIIKLKVAANKQENVTLTAAEKLLNKTKQHQSEITANSKKELENKQELALAGGAIDTQIVKQNQIVAGYEKQAKIAQVQAQIADLDGKKRLANNEILSKSYQLRLDITQKQLDLENGSQSGIQRQFKLAQDLALTEYQKQELAETAAKQELLSLGKKQAIEQNLLDMQIKSNELAYERELIEQEVNKLKLAAALKVAEAEDKKVQVSLTSTKEDKAASTATVEAKQFELASQKYTDYFLQEKGKSLQQSEQIQQFNLGVKQKDERQDKNIAYANTQFSSEGRDDIYRAIVNSLTPIINGLRDVRINTSAEFLNPLFSLPRTPNISNPGNITLPSSPSDINLTAPTIATNGAKNNIVPSNPNVNKTPVNVTLNVTNDIKVSGKDGTVDFEKKLMDSAVLTTKKMYDIIRNTNTELGN